jgi:predicted DNA-binding protein
MSEKGGMERTTVWRTKNQVARLKALAERTGLKVAEHIRRAIDSYLDRVAPEERGANDGKSE